MPTSSGASSLSRPDRLLYKRDSSTRHHSINTYSSAYNGTSYPTRPSFKDQTSYTLNSRNDTLSRDLTTKLDLNNNTSKYTADPYKPSYRSSYKNDYASYISPSSSKVHTAHYSTKSIGTTGSLYPTSRSSSVDSSYEHSRTRRSNLASQNYNDSCSSHGSDTSLKVTTGAQETGNVGLTNLGNTCFMNSVLQCLLNTKSLKDYVTSSQRSQDINRTTSSMKGALMHEYEALVRKVWEDGSSTSIAPRELKHRVTSFAPRFGGYNQHDAQEFLRYFLQGLHEDVNRVKTKPKYIGNDEEAESKMTDSEKAREYWRRYINFDDSAIVDLFVGQLKSELICQTCGYRSVTFDPFWDLSLPIPKRGIEVDIHGCMESFMKEEILDGIERPTCAKCKEHRRCTKKFKIQKFPKILVLHLKRFSGERYRQKLSTKVNFELTNFDLRQFGVDQEKPVKYNLYGIANHVGNVYSGHYTAYCRHPYKGRWYSFNDSRVNSISSSDLVSEEAYVLFYERV